MYQTCSSLHSCGIDDSAQFHGRICNKVPDFSKPTYPRNRHDIGAQLCRKRVKRRNTKNDNCEIGSTNRYMMHMPDNISHGTKSQSSKCDFETPCQELCNILKKCGAYSNTNTSYPNSSRSDSNNLRTSEREIGGGNEQRDSKNNRPIEMEDVCMDFMSIVQDAVLEAVELTVEKCLNKFLCEMSTHLADICEQTTQSQCAIKAMKCDILHMMKEYNEKNECRMKKICSFLKDNVDPEEIEKTNEEEEEGAEQLEEQPPKEDSNISPISASKCTYSPEDLLNDTTPPCCCKKKQKERENNCSPSYFLSTSRRLSCNNSPTHSHAPTHDLSPSHSNFCKKHAEMLNMMLKCNCKRQSKSNAKVRINCGDEDEEEKINPNNARSSGGSSKKRKHMPEYLDPKLFENHTTSL